MLGRSVLGVVTAVIVIMDFWLEIENEEEGELFIYARNVHCAVLNLFRSKTGNRSASALF